MYSCHLFLISSASVRSLLFLSFTVPVLYAEKDILCVFVLECVAGLHRTGQLQLLSFLRLLLSTAFQTLLLTLRALPVLLRDS